MSEQMVATSDDRLQFSPNKIQTLLTDVNKKRPNYRNLSTNDPDAYEALLGLYHDAAEATEESSEKERMLLILGIILEAAETDGKYIRNRQDLIDAMTKESAEAPSEESLEIIDTLPYQHRNNTLNMTALGAEMISVISREVARLCDDADAMTVTVSRKPVTLFRIHTIAEADQDGFAKRRERVLTSLLENTPELWKQKVADRVTATDNNRIVDMRPKNDIEKANDKFVHRPENSQLIATLKEYVYEVGKVSYRKTEKLNAILGIVRYLEGGVDIELDQQLELANEFIEKATEANRQLRAKRGRQ